MFDFLNIILLTALALFPIIDPIGAAPLFLSITDGCTPDERKQQAKRGSIYMWIILCSFFLFGVWIMSFFGISIPGIRIAGGILVCKFSLDMLYPTPKLNALETKESKAKDDISLFPLAMPYLSGPGAISVTISLTTLVKKPFDYFPILIGITLIGIVTYICLRSANLMHNLLGVTGINALTKFLGFIMFCIGIQLIINGAIDLKLIPNA